MLTDFEYQPPYGKSFGIVSLSPAVKGILMATIVMFLLQQITDMYLRIMVAGRSVGAFTWWLGLSRPMLLQGSFWQLGTYAFLHGGIWHMLMNMLGLVIFGPQLERVFGAKRFFLLYIASAGLAGIGWVFISGRGPAVCIGASGAVFSLLGAYGAMFPNRVITLLLFFVIPVTMTARTLVILLGLITLLSLLGRPDGVAHMAHLAGGIAGYVYGLRMAREGCVVPSSAWSSVGVSRRGVRIHSWLRTLRAGWRRRLFRSVKSATFKRENHEPAAPTTEEINAVLEKIHRCGLRTLSRRDRDVLDAASRRMRRE